MSLGYAQEKAFKILDSLGSGEGALRQRLLSASIPSLMSLVNECEQHTSGLHNGLEAEIVALFEVRLNSQPAVGDQGSIEANLESLDDLEVMEVAERLVALCIEVMQQRGEGDFMLGAGRDDPTDD